MDAVVCAEDGVDGEFGAEGAEVAGAYDEGLRGDGDLRHGFEGGVLDGFEVGGGEDLTGAGLGFGVFGGGVVEVLFVFFVEDEAVLGC